MPDSTDTPGTPASADDLEVPGLGPDSFAVRARAAGHGRTTVAASKPPADDGLVRIRCDCGYTSPAAKYRFARTAWRSHAGPAMEREAAQRAAEAEGERS